MNPRIRELISQSQKEVWGNNLYNGSPEFEGYVLDSEKFAELLIQECISELQSSLRGDSYTGEVFDCEYNTCITEQTTMLKEHFGVEE